ncbi:helicase associated domain-containing protein [Streptomyces sp. SP17BM10]|uniref:helicase associated domain-containing protein n=1 Tax=Streptomyces sp. SP17BM10 TaxID=3002530 RepID=UPI003FCDB6C9
MRVGGTAWLLPADRADHGPLQALTKYVTEDGDKLGAWIGQQRKYYTKGWLREQHVTELEKLGVIRDVYDARFSGDLAAARAYRPSVGTCGARGSRRGARSTVRAACRTNGFGAAGHRHGVDGPQEAARPSHREAPRAANGQS